MVVDDHDKNSRTVWEFYYHLNKLWLDKYSTETRKTSRSKWGHAGPYFHRTSSRNSNITEDQVPLPEEVKAEAIKALINEIEVLRWDEHRHSRGGR